ncbi:MAG: hypothetical protein ACHQT8_04710 [Chlamydiales bacterium]
MRKRAMTLALSGLIAGFCLTTGELSAWQRTATEDCKKEMDNCKQDANNCNKEGGKKSGKCRKMIGSCKQNHRQCKKDAESSDEASFATNLNKSNRNLFKELTPDQKKNAMDYADKNKMSPNDAMAKVVTKK